jgi:hypothetical protein
LPPHYHRICAAQIQRVIDENNNVDESDDDGQSDDEEDDVKNDGQYVSEQQKYDARTRQGKLRQRSVYRVTTTVPLTMPMRPVYNETHVC